MPVLLGIREIVSPRSLLDHTDKPFVAT